LQSPLEFLKVQNTINHSCEEIWNWSIHFISALIILKAVWGPMFPAFFLNKWINRIFTKTQSTLPFTQGGAVGKDTIQINNYYFIFFPLSSFFFLSFSPSPCPFLPSFLMRKLEWGFLNLLCTASSRVLTT
jgi:hypothetical protein